MFDSDVVKYRILEIVQVMIYDICYGRRMYMLCLCCGNMNSVSNTYQLHCILASLLGKQWNRYTQFKVASVKSSFVCVVIIHGDILYCDWLVICIPDKTAVLYVGFLFQCLRVCL